MNAFVFDSHENNPKVIMPVFDVCNGGVVDGVKNNAFDFVSEILGGSWGGPVVVAGVEVVPVHLVDTHRKHLFEAGIDPVLDDAVVEHFVDVYSRGVSVVEDEGVAEGFGPNEVGLFVSDDAEELLVESIGLKEVLADR
jgi:hypothetical protein